MGQPLFLLVRLFLYLTKLILSENNAVVARWVRGGRSVWLSSAEPPVKNHLSY